jgi:pentatricopeptide repeat protein
LISSGIHYTHFAVMGVCVDCKGFMVKTHFLSAASYLSNTALVLIFNVIPIFFFLSFLLVFDFDMIPNSSSSSLGFGYELGFGIAVKCDCFDWCRYNDAFSLYQYFFNQYNIVPDYWSYNILVKIHCKEGRVDEALEVCRHMIKNYPDSSSVETRQHLMKGLIDAGRIEEALDLFREMKKQGVFSAVVYNPLIKWFLELGNLDKANELRDEFMETRWVCNDSGDRGVVYATFMDWFFNQGKMKEAMESYKSWLDRPIDRIVPETYNVLLEVLLKHGKEKEAWALFDLMLDKHLLSHAEVVNSDTFNIMVNECFKLGKIEEAIPTFKMVGRRRGSKAFEMDVAGYNNIIARFCENGMLLEAEMMFAELTAKPLPPDATSHRTLIDAFLKADRIDVALKLFKRMVDARLSVDANFGNRVFDELIKNGKVVDCAQILSKMGEKVPKPDPSCYEVVIKGLCNESILDKSQDLLKEMMRYGVGLTPALQESVREAFGKAGFGEEIERLLCMNGCGSSTTEPDLQQFLTCIGCSCSNTWVNCPKLVETSESRKNNLLLVGVLK